MKYDNLDILTAGEQYLGIPGHGGCTLAEFQRYLMKLLREIDRICRKNDIQYFLMYGSLIGAVRHNGFIPWDDDADIVMTRHDYNRFRECCRSELGSEFDLVSAEDDENYGYTFPKLRLKNTTYIIRSEVSRHGRSAGFFIDIILMDYLSDNPRKAHRQQRAMMAMHRLISPGFYQSEMGLNTFENFLVGSARKILGRKRVIRMMEKIASSASPEESSNFVAEIFLPNVNYFYVYDKRHFEKGIDVPFEDAVLRIPQDSIRLLHKMYLRSAAAANILMEYRFPDEQEAITKRQLWYYNDIMFIPPDRSRSRHLEIVFDKDHASSYYDGRYFEDFNKAENDRCAVKERASRENGRKYLNIMNRNEGIARSDCYEIMLRDCLKDARSKYPDPGDMSDVESVQLADSLSRLTCCYSKWLDGNALLYCLRVMIKSGRGGMAQKLCMKLSAEHPELDISLEKDYADSMMRAYYAVFENKIDIIREYAESAEGFFAHIMSGITAYSDGDDSKAESILRECITIDDSAFLAHYYLGLIAVRAGNTVGAEKMFLEAVNDSNYMPLIQLALDKLKEIWNDKQSINN